MPITLLVLGIDAASPELLRRWAACGKLPALRGLMERGTSGSVRGVRGFFIGSTWPSFYTGLNPAGHGFYRIEQLKSGTYDFFRPLESPLGIGGTPFWRLASDAGRRVAVLDVPLTRLEPDLNGIQTVEWGGHDAVFGFQASPPELARDVLSCVGPYPLPSDCDGDRRTASDFETFVRSLERAVAKKTELTLDLLGREPWSVFVQVFTEAHCAGHQCWHIHDPEHPAHDAALLAALGDPLERVYRALDRALATIVERAKGAHVLLVSAHGMSHYRGAKALLPEILFRLGVTARPPVAPPWPRTLRSRLMETAGVAWRALPGAARESLGPLRARLTPSRTPAVRLPQLRADLARSRCFPVPNGSPVGGIRLNLAGREPEGVLQAGPEADAFCDELARDLRAIVDERTGRPLIADVQRTDALYAGARRDALPDLLVEWTADPPTGTLVHGGGRGATVRATSPGIGTVEGTNAYGRTGENVPTGMFVCAGPGVAATERAEPVSVMDFHPTICRLLGLPDAGVDGAVIDEIVTPRT
jgi:predicted AlkP superfamily phosphohydrolase/phosphomutase